MVSKSPANARCTPLLAALATPPLRGAIVKPRSWFCGTRGRRARDPVRGILPFSLALALAAACALDAPSPPAAVVVTDSAGVRIVHLGDATPAVIERRGVATEPDLVIRSREDEGGSVLAGVRDVEVLPHGRIAVVNGRGNEILVFDASGERVATWGGTGSGPGEFRQLDWLANLPPDSLAAGDRGLRRVTVLDAAGGYVRSFRMADAVDPASSPIPPRPMGLLADGSMIGAVFSQPEPVEGTARPAVDIAMIAPDGGSVHAIGTWPGDELAIFEQDGLLEVTQPPFGRRLHIAPTSDGVWIGDDDRWEARKYSAQGDLRMVVRSSASPSAVTEEIIEASIGERYRYADQGPAVEQLKRDQREIAQHTTTPSFGKIVGTANGGVAVGEFGLGTATSRRWIAVDASGTVAAIELPSGFDVKRWRRDWVVGVVRDALDREEVHRYRILRGAGQG